MNRISLIGFALIAVSLIAWSVLGHENNLHMPDPALTPGAVIPGYQMRCSPPYSPPRVWHDKHGTLAKYGIPPGAADKFEDDDRVPVCLGGNNANPLNHWAEPCDEWKEDHRCTHGEAHDKDILERDVCRAICAGRLSLEQGQKIFLGDWRRYIGGHDLP